MFAETPERHRRSVGSSGSLWRMGIELSAPKSGVWDNYKQRAAAPRERAQRDIAEDRRAAAKMRARLRARRHGSLSGGRGDPGMTAARLHALLAEAATGLPPEPRRKAYVRLDNTIGTRSCQRTGLEFWGEDLVLAAWPGAARLAAQ